MEENDLYYCDGFEWDEGNSSKNWFLHQVTDAECEEVFFNIPLIVADDAQHSKIEKRYFGLWNKFYPHVCWFENTKPPHIGAAK